MREPAGFILFSVILAAGAAALTTAYFLPTIVALVRRPAGLVAEVIVLNVLLGWTLLGWAASLAIAVSGSSTSRVAPQPPLHGYELPVGIPHVHVPIARLGDSGQGAAISDTTSSIGLGL